VRVTSTGSTVAVWGCAGVAHRVARVAPFSTPGGPPPPLSLLARVSACGHLSGVVAVGGGCAGEEGEGGAGGCGAARVAGAPRAHSPWVTSVAFSGDESALLTGLSNGVLQVRHGMTLEAGGWLLAGAGGRGGGGDGGGGGGGGARPGIFENLGKGLGKGALALSTAVAGTALADTPIGGAFATGLARFSRRAMPAQAHGADAFLPPPRAASVGAHLHAAPRAEDAYEPPHALPAVALTALAFQPGEAALLVGTGDGRLVCVTDGRAAAEARERVAAEVDTLG
jgi:hypothetical protein